MLDYSASFDLIMMLVEIKLDDIQNTIMNIYETENQGHDSFTKLKKETDNLLKSVTPETEDQEIIHSELKFKFLNLISEYHNIYHILN